MPAVSSRPPCRCCYPIRQNRRPDRQIRLCLPQRLSPAPANLPAVRPMYPSLTPPGAGQTASLCRLRLPSVCGLLHSRGRSGFRRPNCCATTLLSWRAPLGARAASGSCERECRDGAANRLFAPEAAVETRGGSVIICDPYYRR
jgi:hypothetical protein